jgi:hypothetical protein
MHAATPPPGTVHAQHDRPRRFVARHGFELLAEQRDRVFPDREGPDERRVQDEPVDVDQRDAVRAALHDDRLDVPGADADRGRVEPRFHLPGHLRAEHEPLAVAPGRERNRHEGEKNAAHVPPFTRNPRTADLSGVIGTTGLTG